MRLPPLADAAGIHLLRFLIMFVVLEVAGAVGVEGWYLGLVANIAVTIFAIVLMTKRRLWRSSGATVAWRSWAAFVVLIPLAFEAISWALPAGLLERDPGYALWAVTLLLVGINEELISRGVVLSRLREAYRPIWAVTFTASLFGLQHLSAFALTSRAAGDIFGNVALSAVAGFALAAYQWRFRWIWPLILVHGVADFTTVLAAEPLSDPFIGLAHVMMLAMGLALLRWPQAERTGAEGSEYLREFARGIWRVVIEDDGHVAHAYLLRDNDIVSDVWLWNRGPAPDVAPWTLGKDMPFCNPAEYVADDAPNQLSADELAVHWMDDSSESWRALISWNGRLIASMAPGARPGWSAHARRNGPLAQVLDSES